MVRPQEPEHEPQGATSDRIDESEHVAAVTEVTQQRQAILQEIKKVIVGQDHVIEELLIALLARGHCLLVGVPGLAKTLLISTLAEVLHLHFNRVQFTPDLMPADLIGTMIYDQKVQEFRVKKGPVFAQIVLADEINRTPPKTQAALLEAMQEYHVTAAGRTYPLDQPFFVLATQNPIEQEGTYPLPEAQLDRFMFNIKVDYPSAAEEQQILAATTRQDRPEVAKVLSQRAILNLQKLVGSVAVSEHIIKYAASLVRATRPKDESAPKFVRDLVDWGAGPRAGQALGI